MLWTTIELINKYENETFSTWRESDKLLIKSAEDKDNKRGYNFYIIKLMKKG